VDVTYGIRAATGVFSPARLHARCVYCKRWHNMGLGIGGWNTLFGMKFYSEVPFLILDGHRTGGMNIGIPGANDPPAGGLAVGYGVSASNDEHDVGSELRHRIGKCRYRNVCPDARSFRGTGNGNTIAPLSIHGMPQTEQTRPSSSGARAPPGKLDSFPTSSGHPARVMRIATWPCGTRETRWVRSR